MSKFYFLQEAIAAGPIMLFLYLLIIIALIIAVVITVATLKKIKKISVGYKESGIKKDSTFIIINFSIVTVLLIGLMWLLYKISNITFD